MAENKQVQELKIQLPAIFVGIMKQAANVGDSFDGFHWAVWIGVMEWQLCFGGVQWHGGDCKVF